MGVKESARDRLIALLDRECEPAYLWKQSMPFLGQTQTICLFGFEAEPGFCLGLVAEHGAEPWILPAPEWETLRKGKREREIAALELYLGQAIYAKRSLGPASAKLLEFGERKRQAALKHPQASEAELVEVVHVKGFGGNHTVVRRTMSTGRLEFVSKTGRIISPSRLTLAARAAHPMWAFLALENLPQRRWGALGWS